ncbi:hypothetical protein Desor_3821 [Desulfosporosinus orientis DSM 765]|uniref:Lipoprotein n=1 Tax=Desulfosporosinus orientis (strain ATCC 19365 / DSM 765 / NCIMB 8382 / VKM B-1628 / Singapore I) TaxID=768706 RepID=G7W9E3_DESOD|nr:hypothetical protein [Desulfosporosinus orientis]AET69280.1 hypothetical protein Desor_3821 [Desulfosporosinus orientis DSM 765]
MKRIFSALLVVVLAFTMLAGCSSGKQTASQKTEEELRAEIKEEMAASQIVLSALMTKDEIINKLGEGYTFETEQDNGYFTYCSSLKYEGITFDFFYDTEKLPEGKTPDVITIASDKYVFNYDFKVGEPAQKAFDYCEKNFKHAYDMHMGQNIFDAFLYKEKKSSGETVDTNMTLRWEYDKEGDFSSKREVPADAGIKTVQLIVPFD